VPELENKLAVAVRRCPRGFQICLDNGEVATVRKLVMAVGISHYAYIPPALASLPEELRTHSSQHRNVERFNGREVIVVGAGASAADLAALLSQAGALTRIVARTQVVQFQDPPGPVPRPMGERIRSPLTGIGTGWKVWFVCNAPHFFHRLPESLRLRVVSRTNGPAPAWFVREQVLGAVPLTLGVNIAGANVQNGRVALRLTNGNGAERVLSSDHVIAATGYRVDLRCLSFLEPEIRAQVRSVEQTPVLSSNFESSVPGLYFVGVSAANSFGPLLRFAFGAGFTARRLAKHLEKSLSRDRAVAGDEAACTARPLMFNPEEKA
jgi:thioredoxin reductase